MVEITSKKWRIQNSTPRSTPCVESLADPTGLSPLAVDPNQAAVLLNSTYSSLEKDRANGHMGVPYVKAGRRVIYRLADLDKWLTANRIVPSSKGVNHE
jgi:hypothetical protein